MFYNSISEFFEVEGDFEENLRHEDTCLHPTCNGVDE